jgi:hypothetical protein
VLEIFKSGKDDELILQDNMENVNLIRKEFAKPRIDWRNKNVVSNSNRKRGLV